jgi:hypothetical protein
MKIASAIRDIGLSLDGRGVDVVEEPDLPRKYACDYVGMAIVAAPDLAAEFASHAVKTLKSLAPSLVCMQAQVDTNMLAMFICLAEDQSIFAGPFTDAAFDWFEQRHLPFDSDEWEILCIAHVLIDHPHEFRSLMLSHLGISIATSLYREN